MKDKKFNFNKYDGFIMAYIALNGFSVGNTASTVGRMIDDGYSHASMICLLLWLGMVAHTANRIYQVKRDKKNHENNQNQR